MMKETKPYLQELSTLGPLRLWQVEWKWAGKKVQMHLHDSTVTLTDAQGHPMVSPELPADSLEFLPDETTLEGILVDGSPNQVVIWDCVQFLGADLTGMPLYARQLQAFPIIGSLESPHFRTSEPLPLTTWEAVSSLRPEEAPPQVTGVVLKKTDSLYATEDLHGTWWTKPFAP